jgi:ribosomal protein L37AE/L43A
MTDTNEKCRQCECLLSMLNVDQTGLAAAMSRVLRTVGGYRWLADGEWGSYDYTERTQQTLRKEAGWALDAIQKIAEDGLHESGQRARSAVALNSHDMDHGTWSCRRCGVSMPAGPEDPWPGWCGQPPEPVQVLPATDGRPARAVVPIGDGEHSLTYDECMQLASRLFDAMQATKGRRFASIEPWLEAKHDCVWCGAKMLVRMSDRRQRCRNDCASGLGACPDQFLPELEQATTRAHEPVATPLPSPWSCYGQFEDNDEDRGTWYVRFNGRCEDSDVKLADTTVYAYDDGTVHVDDPHGDLGLAELHAVLAHILDGGGGR